MNECVWAIWISSDCAEFTEKSLDEWTNYYPPRIDWMMSRSINGSFDQTHSLQNNEADVYWPFKISQKRQKLRDRVLPIRFFKRRWAQEPFHAISWSLFRRPKSIHAAISSIYLTACRQPLFFKILPALKQLTCRDKIILAGPSAEAIKYYDTNVSYLDLVTAMPRQVSVVPLLRMAELLFCWPLPMLAGREGWCGVIFDGVCVMMADTRTEPEDSSMIHVIMTKFEH